MKSSDIIRRITTLMLNRKPFLLTGSPGLGKTDCIVAAAKAANMRCIISHPVVSDPTDYKGLPAVVDGGAQFLPFGDLQDLIDCTDPTVFFLDDIGQAPASVQAALMQLVLCRKINGHRISDNVTFAAATNRRSDKAGVGTFITPLLDRFDQVYALDFDINDWVGWALQNGQPESIVGFARFRPSLVSDFKQPKDDLSKCPTPRSVAKLGELIKLGLDDFDTYSAACGEGFASEFAAFRKTRDQMPDIDDVIKSPDDAPMPTRPDVLYATAAALAFRVNAGNFANILRYGDRMSPEFRVMLVKDCLAKSRTLERPPALTKWLIANQGVILG